ncbi:MAG: hypothetical protein NT010_16925 [Proteobacteria bacterium]|nr:hypothetical protein [Pseudomonadota bacterium]
MKKIMFLMMLICGIFIVSADVGAINYTVTDLGSLGVANSAAYGINNTGQVVGYSATSGGSDNAFLYSNGTMKNLGTLGGTWSAAYGINNAGQVVGYSTNTSGNSAENAFLYSNGTMQNLGTLGGTWSAAYGINNAGHVVGSSQISGNSAHNAFLYSNGTMQNLGTLGGNYSYANGINNAGQVVGAANTPGDSATNAFLYSNGNMQNLGTLGGTHSYANGINNAGQVVGLSYTSGGAANAFLYSNGTMQNLGALGGTYSQAYGINNAGQVVGSSYISSGNTAQNAFLYSNGTMQNLNSLVLQGSFNGTLWEARAINDKGQIAGYANINGQTRAVLLNPAAVIPSTITLESKISPQTSNTTVSTAVNNARLQIMAMYLNASNSMEILDVSGSGDTKQFIKLGSNINKFNPDKDTIVITHGWNPDGSSTLPSWITGMGNNFIKQNQDANIIAWNWQERAGGGIGSIPYKEVPGEGLVLASFLNGILGNDYGKNIQIVGHSLGSGVATWAADSLQNNYNKNVTRLTILDGPENGAARLDLDNLLNKIKSSTLIENFVSRYGVFYTGFRSDGAPIVQNIKLFPQSYNYSGPIDEHSYSYDWYNKTINNSVTVGYKDSYSYSSSYLLQNKVNEYQLSAQSGLPMPPIVFSIPIGQESQRNSVFRLLDKVFEDEYALYNLVNSLNSLGKAYVVNAAEFAYLHLFSNSPVLVSMGINLPADAQYMAFDLNIFEKHTGDIFALYWNDTLITSFYTESLALNEWRRINGIDFKQYAGTEGTLTFGLLTQEDGIQSQIGIKDIEFYNYQPVPIPSAIYLLAPGLLGLVGLKRKYLG